MRFAFLQDHQGRYPVVTMARVLDVSVAGFYVWASRPVSDRARSDVALLPAIRRIHTEADATYGSRRLQRDLGRGGHPCSRTRARRLMRLAGVSVKTRRKFRVTTDSKHNFPVATNVLDRQFEAHHANETWLTDITYLWTDAGWLYLAVVLDLYSRRIIGWAMQPRMTVDLVQNALTMALWRRKPGAGLLHHSDRGSQYACGDYQSILAAAGITVSMSRKGNCWDNAPMESFFRSLKVERVYHRRYVTREEAKRDVLDYLAFYNSRRLHSSLGYVSPMEFETMEKTS